MPACPILRFKRDKLIVQGKLHAVRIYAIANKQTVGEIFVAHRVGTDFAQVTSLAVHAAMRRCGIGTKLYEEAAKTACRAFKSPLHSDKERSAAAQGFWAKQERKGRATCVERMRESQPPDSDPAEGRGGCVRYKLSCPAPRSLAGARR